MKERIDLEIGGVAISAQSKFELESLNKEYDWRFTHFISKKKRKPDINLEVVVSDKLLKLDKSKRIFKVRHPQADADDWALYKFKDRFALEYYYTGNPGQRERVVFLNERFDEGTVYALPPHLMPSQQRERPAPLAPIESASNQSSAGARTRNRTIRVANEHISPLNEQAENKRAKKNKYTWNSHLVIYGCLQILLINYLAKKDGLIIHSIGLKDIDKRGLLFAGESGAGKSTTAKLWHKHSQAAVLNDDRMIIRRQNGKFFLYGTPWHGDFNDYLASRTDIAPLSQIYFIHHALENIIKPLTAKQAYSFLFPNIFPPFWDRELMEEAASFCRDLVESVPCFKFGFAKSKKVIGAVRENKASEVAILNAS